MKVCFHCPERREEVLRRARSSGGRGRAMEERRATRIRMPRSKITLGPIATVTGPLRRRRRRRRRRANRHRRESAASKKRRRKTAKKKFCRRKTVPLPRVRCALSFIQREAGREGKGTNLEGRILHPSSLQATELQGRLRQK